MDKDRSQPYGCGKPWSFVILSCDCRHIMHWRLLYRVMQRHGALWMAFEEGGNTILMAVLSAGNDDLLQCELFLRRLCTVCRAFYLDVLADWFSFSKNFAALSNPHLMWECVERCLSMCDRTLKNCSEKCYRNTVERPPLYFAHHTKKTFPCIAS